MDGLNLKLFFLAGDQHFLKTNQPKTVSPGKTLRELATNTFSSQGSAFHPQVKQNFYAQTLIIKNSKMVATKTIVLNVGHGDKIRYLMQCGC